MVEADMEGWVPITGVGIAFVSTLFVVISFFRRVIREKEQDSAKVVSALRAEAEVRATERRASISELHRRIDETQRDLSAFKEQVSQHYATNAYLREVENRLTTSIRETEGRLAGDIDSSEKRIVVHLNRIEERFDRVIMQENKK